MGMDGHADLGFDMNVPLDGVTGNPVHVTQKRSKDINDAENDSPISVTDYRPSPAVKGMLWTATLTSEWT